MAKADRWDTVFVVDDDEAVRESLAALLEASGYEVRTFASGAEFLAIASRAGSGCLLLDVRLPDLNGLEVQERLRQAGVSLPVIVISGHGEVATAVKAMKAGAIDFIEKPFSRDIILATVERALAAGGSQRPRGSDAADIKAKLATLSPRERDVLEQLVIGYPNKVIAQSLKISPRTVEIYRKNVMEKMQANSLSHLVRLAMAGGIDPEPI